MQERYNYAVSEVVGFIFVLTIVTGAISFVLFWGIPYMNQESAKARLDSALTQFDFINGVIRDEVIRQGNGSSSIVSFTTDSGSINIYSQGERLIFYYSMYSDFEFNVTELGDEDETEFGLTIKEGNIFADELWVHYLYNDVTEEIDINSPETSNALSDAVEMYILHTSGAPSRGVVGRIWLFDTGSIIYRALSSSGTYKAIAENGGIVSNRPGSSFLYDEPNVIVDDERLAMRIIQFKPVTSITGSGKATYRFTIKLNYSDILVESEDIKGSFRVQIYGDDAAVKAWTNYFNSTLGFKKFIDSTAKGTLYLPGDRSFTLTQSICKVYVDVS